MGRKFGEASSGEPVDVSKVLDCDAWQQLLLFVGDGALVSVGTTRDRGAVSVTVTVNGEWERTYVRDSEQLTLWVEDATEAVREALEEARPSAERPKRRKGLRSL